MQDIGDAFASAEPREIDELILKDRIAEGAPAALFDWRGKKSFDGEAAAEFSQWLQQARTRLSALAILTATREWHLLLATLGLEARIRLKPFIDEDEALAWLNAVRTAESDRQSSRSNLEKLRPPIHGTAATPRSTRR